MIEISVFTFIFVCLFFIAVFVAILALWSSNKELERRCEFLLRENLMLIQQNISKKVIDTTSLKR